MKINVISRVLFLGALLFAGGCGNGDGDSPGAVPGDDDDDDDDDTDGGPPEDSCVTIDDASLSEHIGTVGIVEFSTAVENVTSATIEFGLDTEYGHSAPVDLEEENYRTLLLGMKPVSDYHFRVVVEGEDESCTSEDYALETTAPSPNGLPRIDIETMDEDALAGGFLVTSTFQEGSAYILDADGDFVWWFDHKDFSDDPEESGEITRARMSYDGKYMWLVKGNVPRGKGARVVRVEMDGSNPEDLTEQFSEPHHDLAMLPDGRVLYLTYSDEGCDLVGERSPDGSTRIIADATDILGEEECHLNALAHSPLDDTIVVSELETSHYFKITMEGEVVWVLGAKGPFTGDGASWTRNHGLHVLAEDRILIFSNGAMQNGVSRAIEIELDVENETATRRWEYFESGLSNAIMGDVQRLYNGNTLITYSQLGIIHEVNDDGELLQLMTWPIGGAIGYATKRGSLYGPPPK